MVGTEDHVNSYLKFLNRFILKIKYIFDVVVNLKDWVIEQMPLNRG